MGYLLFAASGLDGRPDLHAYVVEAVGDSDMINPLSRQAYQFSNKNVTSRGAIDYANIRTVIHEDISTKILPSAMEDLIRRELFEMSDDNKPIITAKGRAYLRRLESK